MSDGDEDSATRVGKDRLEAVELVLRAYAAAQASGREGWREMKLAVLKNRLLDLTARTFDESDWGAANLRGFVELLAPVVTLKEGPGPGAAILADDVEVQDYAMAATAPTSLRFAEWGVRPDLWDAVIDYRSGARYLWHEGQVLALDPQGEPPPGALDLPTVAPEELLGWRREFSDQSGADKNSELGRALEEWAAKDVSSRRLPARPRNQWFGVLKRHVRARLEEWFVAQGVEAPPDLLVEMATAAPVESIDSDVEHLRNVVLRAVRAMTGDELRALSLPASVTARLLR